MRLGNKASTESPLVFPFWHLQRNKGRSKCNCVMTALSATSITTIGAPGSDKVPMSTKEWPVLVNDETCDVPVCTNDAALAAGDELVLFKPEKSKAESEIKSSKHVDAGEGCCGLRTRRQEAEAVSGQRS